PRIPGPVLVVQRYSIAETQVARRLADDREDMLEGELGRVDADDHEPVLRIGAVPRLEVRERAQAVDARVRPEVDQDDLAAQLRDRERTAVQPVIDAGEVRRRAIVGQTAGDSPDRLPARHALAADLLPCVSGLLRVALEEVRP